MAAKRSSTTPNKRRPGAQPGNVNALRHGFYSKAMDLAAQAVYATALELPPDDLTDEIANLRTRLFFLLKHEPMNSELLVKGIGQLARLAATQYHLSGTAADHLADAMQNVLEDIERTLATEGD